MSGAAVIMGVTINGDAPCLLFASHEEAAAFLDSRGLVREENGTYKRHKSGKTVEEWLARYDNWRHFCASYISEGSGTSAVGGIYRFEISSVDFNRPLVSFDNGGNGTWVPRVRM